MENQAKQADHILGTIKRSDIFPDEAPVPEEELGKLRKAVRVVLFDENKNIALNYYPAKENLAGAYGLPGGGVDEGESVKGALVRESLEETGCQIKNVRESGVIKEFGVGKSVKHNQETYCFMAEVDGEKMAPKFTEEEIQCKLEVRWLPIAEAVNLIQNQSLSFYKTRDLMCLGTIRD